MSRAGGVKLRSVDHLKLSRLDAFMSPILVLTPLAVEHAALKQALGEEFLSTGQVQLAIGGHGKVQFALGTQLMIQKYAPALVICAGAAGALAPQLKLLDVVIAERTIEHDFKLRFIPRPQPEFAAAPGALEKLRGQTAKLPFGLYFGAIASGDEDVVDLVRAQALSKETRALAVAWEGAGGARAAKLHGIPFLEIRALTDSADHRSVQTFAENIEPAMNHLAMVLRALLH